MWKDAQESFKLRKLSNWLTMPLAKVALIGDIILIIFKLIYLLNLYESNEFSAVAYSRTENKNFIFQFFHPIVVEIKFLYFFHFYHFFLKK